MIDTPTDVVEQWLGDPVKDRERITKDSHVKQMKLWYTPLWWNFWIDIKQM